MCGTKYPSIEIHPCKYLCVCMYIYVCIFKLYVCLYVYIYTHIHIAQEPINISYTGVLFAPSKPTK